MNLPASDNNLLILWIVTTTLSILFTIPIVRWAIRSGQFKNMDRSRYLPLDHKTPR